MGIAIMCLFAVYGVGAMLWTIIEGFLYRKRCTHCKVTLCAEVSGGECCEWTVRQLLHEAKDGRLPVTRLVLYAADDETRGMLARLCKDHPGITIEEQTDALRADYGDGVGDCFLQP